MQKIFHLRCGLDTRNPHVGVLTPQKSSSSMD